MVITVTCPSCSASFPVDPAKIPEGGVKARCSSCGDIFRIEKPAPAPALPTLEDLPPAVPAPPAMAEPEPEPEPVVSAPEPVVPEPAPPVMSEPAPPPPPPPAPEPVADPFAQPAPFEEPAAAEAPAPAAPAAGVQGFTFGKRDPTDKAKRLARVLVSDMIMYNAERHQTALASGTLVQDFEDEIDKSWKEFVEQVGEELANGAGRQFWTDALNDILAKGEKVF